MTFIKRLLALVKGINHKAPARRSVADVKPGENIRVEWRMIENRIGYLKCLANDPVTKKILLEVKWSNHQEAHCEPKQQVVWSYNDAELKNFHLLNNATPLPAHQKPVNNEENLDIASLQKQINEALEQEEYEVADELQKKIDKLLQNPT